MTAYRFSRLGRKLHIWMSKKHGFDQADQGKAALEFVVGQTIAAGLDSGKVMELMSALEQEMAASARQRPDPTSTPDKAEGQGVAQGER